MFQPSTDQIKAAAARLRPYLRHTPLLPSELGQGTYLKAESLQLGGSFKIRTALNQLLCLSEDERRRGVVASSSGNFAQGLALAARLLSVRATIVMMQSSNPLKVKRTRELGADVVFCENRFEAREQAVQELVAELGAVQVHPYDHPNGIIGNATLGLEILEQLPEVRHIVIPISGGGLIAGVAAAVRQLGSPVEVWGVQPSQSNAAYLSFRDRKARSIPESRTIADGLRVTRPGRRTLPIILEAVREVVTVPEAAILDAVRWALWKERLVVEPSGAVTLAAVKERAVPQDSTVLLLSGGNLDPQLLQEIAQGPAL